MRSPRRIDFTHKAFEKIKLNESPPPADSISMKLWQACIEIAQQALSTNYIQGIANGNLDPNDYGHYSIQDCAYCYNAQGDYQAAEAMAKEAGYPELAAFDQARYDSYVQYTDQLLTDWHISDPNAISPGPAAQQYINFEHQIANTWPAIYFVVAMIPCNQLWAWLATELYPDIKPNNIYNFWITENEDFSAAWRLDNFIDAFFKSTPLQYNWDDALRAYQGAMTGELNFFKSACGQALSPMPKMPSGG